MRARRTWLSYCYKFTQRKDNTYSSNNLDELLESLVCVIVFTWGRVFKGDSVSYSRCRAFCLGLSVESALPVSLLVYDENISFCCCAALLPGSSRSILITLSPRLIFPPFMTFAQIPPWPNIAAWPPGPSALFILEQG